MMMSTALAASLQLSLTAYIQQGLRASQVHQAARDFALHLGKSVCNSQDRPGFIVNRVLMPMINEAFYALMEVFLTNSHLPCIQQVSNWFRHADKYFCGTCYLSG